MPLNPTVSEITLLATATLAPGCLKRIVDDRDCEVRTMQCDSNNTTPIPLWDTDHRQSVFQAAQVPGTPYGQPQALPVVTVIIPYGGSKAAIATAMTALAAAIAASGSPGFVA